MYQKLFESWRKYQKVIKEDVMQYQEYGSSFKEMRELIKDVSGKTWIFFDTETTGLSAEKDFHQVTQIAAIAVDVKNFDAEPEILEKFNVKIQLGQRTRGFMDWDRRKKAEKLAASRAGGVEVAPGIKRVRQEPDKFKGISDIFSMTQYGVSRDPEKAKRKAFLQAKEMPGKENISMEEVPEAAPFMRMVPALKQFSEFLDRYPDRVMVAQNAPFDNGFLNNMYQRIGEVPPDDIVVDTVMIFRKFLTPALKMFKANREAGQELSPEDAKILDALTSDKGKLTVSLGKIIKAFDVENKGWHDALADVTMLLDVLKAVINFLDVRTDLASLEPEPKPEPRVKKTSSQLSLPEPKPSDIG
jgi:DNA polymerase III epsilon subunit-like protein